MVILIEDLKEKIIQKIKGIVKLIIKIIIIKLLPIILICSLILVGIALITYYISTDDAKFKKNDWKNPNYVVHETIISKVNSDNIERNEDGWKLNVDIDSTTDEIIENLDKKTDILDRYISKTNKKNILKAFARAELITQYPDLRSADKIGTPINENEIQGCIQIHRALPNNTDGGTQLLTYTDFDTFNTYITNGNIAATNHFSLDSNGNLVVAGWKKVTKNVSSNIEGVENIENYTEYSLIPNTIDYKSLLKSYTMPFDFLWALLVMSEDEEFTYSVAKLALDSKIIITVQDNLTTVNTNIYKQYSIHQKDVMDTWITAIVDGQEYRKQIKKEYSYEAVNYYTETNIKDETCTTNIELTYADTWITKYTNSYTNVLSTPTVNENLVEEQDTDYTLKLSRVLDESPDANRELNNFLISICGGPELYREKQLKNEAHGTVGRINYNTYEKIFNKKTKTTVTTTTNNYNKGTPTVIEKTDKNSETDNFVTLFLKYKNAQKNISSGAEWLFEVIENNSSSADMVDMVKYLLYKANGEDYGVTTLIQKTYNTYRKWILVALTRCNTNKNNFFIWL